MARLARLTLILTLAGCAAPSAPIPSRTMRLLIIGQSNAANRGETPAIPISPAFQWDAGRFVKAFDPLIGGSGDGGSIWSRLADSLVARGLTDTVELAVVALGGMPAVAFLPDSTLGKRVLDVLKAGYHPTHILWQQGETDAVLGTSQAQYIATVETVIASLRPFTQAPFYLAKSTRCGSIRADPAIRQALEALSAMPNNREGADTDPVSERYDDCHLAALGLEKAAHAWADALAR